MNKEASNFIQHVKTECKKHNVKVDLAPRRYLILTDEGYTRVSGYFCYEDKIIRIAANKPFQKWFEVLVHEFGHFIQWSTDCKAWQKSFYKGKLDSSAVAFEWLSGKRTTTEKLDICFDLARDLELDCERKAYSLIKKFNLPINKDEYAKRANVYVHLYNWIRIKRRWYKSKQIPYDIPEIVNRMPKTLKGSYKTTPKDIMNLFDKYC